LPDPHDSSVSNADIRFYNSQFWIQDQRISYDEIERLVIRRGRRLPHAISDHFSAAKLYLITIPARFDNYVTLDFGESFFAGRPVIDLVLEKLPVSISLGLWTTLLTYLVSIPLGIAKAVRDGQPFDLWTSAVVVVGCSSPVSSGKPPVVATRMSSVREYRT